LGWLLLDFAFAQRLLLLFGRLARLGFFGLVVMEVDWGLLGFVADFELVWILAFGLMGLELGGLTVRVGLRLALDLVGDHL